MENMTQIQWRTHKLVLGNPEDDGAVSLLLRKGLPHFKKAIFDGFGCGAVLWAGIEPGADFRMLCDGAEEYRLCRENLTLLGYDAAMAVTGIPPLLSDYCSDVDTIFFRIPKDLQFALERIAQWADLAPEGTRLYLCGANDEGIKNVASKIEWFGESGGDPIIACHSRMYSFVRGSAKAPQAAEPYKIEFELGAKTLRYLSRPGIFCSDRLDEGTALLLSAMGTLAQNKIVIDLGCGAGVIALTALESGASSVLASDNSFIACETARENLKGRAAVLHGYLSDGIDGHFDLLLSNPPFHKGKQTVEWIGKEWMRACAKVLCEGGAALVVANRFLDYPTMSAPFFESCTAVARSSGFCVWLLKAAAARRGRR